MNILWLFNKVWEYKGETIIINDADHYTPKENNDFWGELRYYWE